MLGIDQDHAEILFQQVKHGFSKDSRGLHGDMGHLESFEPIGKSEQICCHRRKGSNMLPSFIQLSNCQRNVECANVHTFPEACLALCRA